jgi:hypothetical protein
MGEVGRWGGALKTFSGRVFHLLTGPGCRTLLIFTVNLVLLCEKFRYQEKAKENGAYREDDVKCRRNLMAIRPPGHNRPGQQADDCHNQKELRLYSHTLLLYALFPRLRLPRLFSVENPANNPVGTISTSSPIPLF